nr:anaerobic C4-dicarboxylate transporter DcuC [uncultured Cardiobacterium sp.]
MHSATLSILIGVLALIAAGGFIIKGYNAKGVLFAIGIALLVVALALGNDIVKTPSGHPVADVSNSIYALFEKRGGGLGMIIMILIGFSAYMSHVGANDVVIRVLYKPLRHVRSPYVLMIGGFILAGLMSFAIHSATALGVFLMATLFPIMTRLGISAPSAAAICSSTTVVNLAPTAADVILAAEKANANLIDFAFKTILPMSLVALFFVAIAHYYWQRYCDRREGLVQTTSGTPLANTEATALQSDAPLGYFILPFLPIIGLFIFDGAVAEKVELGGLVVLTIFITALLEFARTKKAAKVYEGLEVCYRGMAEGFSAVVVLLVAAGIFAHGLESIGFVKALIESAQSTGAAANVVMLALVIITLIVAIAAGSGNAAFFAFVELAPKLAGQMGINPAYLIAPMMQVSNTGRSLSPVSGVMVAVSGAAKISPLLLVKRNSVPGLVAVLVVVVYTMMFIPK